MYNGLLVLELLEVENNSRSWLEMETVFFLFSNYFRKVCRHRVNRYLSVAPLSWTRPPCPFWVAPAAAAASGSERRPAAAGASGTRASSPWGGRVACEHPARPRPHSPAPNFHPFNSCILRAHRSYSSAASSTWANSSSNPLPVTADTPTTCRMWQGRPIRRRAVHNHRVNASCWLHSGTWI